MGERAGQEARVPRPEAGAWRWVWGERAGWRGRVSGRRARRARRLGVGAEFALCPSRLGKPQGTQCGPVGSVVSSSPAALRGAEYLATGRPAGRRSQRTGPGLGGGGERRRRGRSCCRDDGVRGCPGLGTDRGERGSRGSRLPSGRARLCHLSQTPTACSSRRCSGPPLQEHFASCLSCPSLYIYVLPG